MPGEEIEGGTHLSVGYSCKAEGHPGSNDMRLPSQSTCSPMPHRVRRKLSVSFGGAMTASVRCCADDPPGAKGSHVSECTSKPFHRGMDRSVMQIWMVVAAQALTVAASPHPSLRPR